MSYSGEDSDHHHTPTFEDSYSDAADLDDDYSDDDEDEEVSEESKLQAQKAKMENLFHRISNETVPLRVHDVLIKGNNKTKEELIEAEIEGLRDASSVQELLKVASIVNARLQRLDIFESVNITLDSGPAELPGTTNVIVEVVEIKNPLTGDIGVYSKPEVFICVVYKCAFMFIYLFVFYYVLVSVCCVDMCFIYRGVFRVCRGGLNCNICVFSVFLLERIFRVLGRWMKADDTSIRVFISLEIMF